MVTLVLGLSLLVAFLSTVMTIGNAVNRTDMAKFWALLSTAAMFVTLFIFIVDTYDILGIKKEEQPISIAEQLVPEFSKGEGGKVDNGLEYGVQPLNYWQDNPQPTASYAYDSGIAGIFLLDLLTKRFTGDVSGLTASQKEWLMQHKHLYPADTEPAISEVQNAAVKPATQGHVSENIDDYKQTVIEGHGIVLEAIASPADAVVQDMQIQVLTEDKVVYVLYYPAVEDLKAGDTVQFFGTPIAKSKLSSEAFGTVSTILLYANCVIK